jgi:hypothetical protein
VANQEAWTGNELAYHSWQDNILYS